MNAASLCLDKANKQDEDEKLQAKLRKANKLTHKVFFQETTTKVYH